MREIKTKSVITDADRLAAYTKDINKCNQGDTKGGYNILQLREIVINYFGIDEKKADKMKKEEICEYIEPIIRKIRKDEINIMKNDKNVESLSGIYPGDINKCALSLKKGGISKTKLQKIAAINFKITEKLNKEDLCKLIEERLKASKDNDTDKVLTAIEPLDDKIQKVLKDEEDIKTPVLTLSDLHDLISEF